MIHSLVVAVSRSRFIQHAAGEGVEGYLLRDCLMQLLKLRRAMLAFKDRLYSMQRAFLARRALYQCSERTRYSILTDLSPRPSVGLLRHVRIAESKPYCHSILFVCMSIGHSATYSLP